MKKTLVCLLAVLVLGCAERRPRRERQPRSQTQSRQQQAAQQQAVQQQQPQRVANCRLTDGTLVSFNTMRRQNFYDSQTSDQFAQALAHQYKSLAIFLRDRMGNACDAEHFAKKAMRAYVGQRVQPDHPSIRLVANPLPFVDQMEDLRRIFARGAADQFPLLMAEAQVKYDCWLESVEKGNDAQAQLCRNRLLRAKDAMNTRFEAIDRVCGVRRNCKFQRELSRDQRVMDQERARREMEFASRHIPRWPETSVITTNSPRMYDAHIMENTAMLWRLRSDLVEHDTKVISELAEFRRSVGGLIVAVESYINFDRPSIAEDVRQREMAETRHAMIRDIAERVAAMEAKMYGIGGKLYEGDAAKVALLLDEMEKMLGRRTDCPECVDMDLIIAKLEETQELMEELYMKMEDLENAAAANRNSRAIFAATVNEDVDDGDEYLVIAEEDYFEDEVDGSADGLPLEIYFDWNKDNIRPEFAAPLRDIAKGSLAKRTRIIVQGHTDTSGEEMANLHLSARRARNTARVLESHGIARSKIVIQAMGWTDLRVQTGPGVRNELNRRVVIK